MDRLKIGLVEDDPLVSKLLQRDLKELGYTVTPVAETYEQAVTMISEHKPDLILLDINLKGEKDGIDVARGIKDSIDVPFIFVSSSSDHGTVQRAKEVEPPAYLVKPFNKEDLYAAIEICISNKRRSRQERKKLISEGLVAPTLPDDIFVKEGTTYRKVSIRDIVYLKSDHVYLEIHTAERSMMIRSTIKEMLEKLDSTQFLQVHRSYAVNLEKVTGVSLMVVEAGSQQIPVGKSFRPELLKVLNIS